MTNKPYVVLNSKKHLEHNKIIYFLFGFELAELFLSIGFDFKFYSIFLY